MSLTLTRRRWLWLAALFLAGCDDKPAPSATPSKPRVVSLSPSTTEMMFAIGRGAWLVGRSEHCDHPSEATGLPSVGGFANPNVEAIIALRPSAIVGSRSPAGPALEQKLRAHGIETLFPETDSVAQIGDAIAQLGARFDARGEAERVNAAIGARVEAIARWAAARGEPTAAMVFDVSPLSVAGPGSFVDELIAKAGGRNVIVEGGKWPTIDVERMLVLDPEVIIDGMNIGHGASDLPRTPGWSALRAVKQGRVRRLRGATALRPGPRLAEGLADIAFALHGEEPP